MFSVLGRHDSEDEVQLDFSKGRSVFCRELQYVIHNLIMLKRGYIEYLIGYLIIFRRKWKCTRDSFLHLQEARTYWREAV
jgi:hypothetical protein